MSADTSDFQDGWNKGRMIGLAEGVEIAREFYAKIAEEEVHHAGEDGEIWIVRRIAELIRANMPDLEEK